MKSTLANLESLATGNPSLCAHILSNLIVAMEKVLDFKANAASRLLHLALQPSFEIYWGSRNLPTFRSRSETGCVLLVLPFSSILSHFISFFFECILCMNLIFILNFLCHMSFQKKILLSLIFYCFYLDIWHFLFFAIYPFLLFTFFTKIGFLWLLNLNPYAAPILKHA